MDAIVDLFHAQPESIRHLNGIVRNFRTVELFDNSAGSVLGVLKTTAAILSDEWLGPLAKHGNRYLLFNVDIAVYNRLLKLIHTDTPWEEDEELLVLLREPDTSAKLAERLERVRANLHALKLRLSRTGDAGTNKRLVAYINESMEEGEDARLVTEATISRILNNKYNWNGPALAQLEYYFKVNTEPDLMAEEDEQEEAQDGISAPAFVTLRDLSDFRRLLTNNMLNSSDTFHVGAIYAKTVYDNYRCFLMKRVYKALFRRGAALRKRKLVQTRFINLVLRLASDDEVKNTLKDWFNDSLNEVGISDPRAEALFALLFFHLPLVAIWERLVLHGSVNEMMVLLPLIALVRAHSSFVGVLSDAVALVSSPALPRGAGFPTARLRVVRQERVGHVLHVGSHRAAEPRAVQDLSAGDSRLLERAAGDGALARCRRARQRSHVPLQGGAPDLGQHHGRDAAQRGPGAWLSVRRARNAQRRLQRPSMHDASPVSHAPRTRLLQGERSRQGAAVQRPRQGGREPPAGCKGQRRAAEPHQRVPLGEVDVPGGASCGAVPRPGGGHLLQEPAAARLRQGRRDAEGVAGGAEGGVAQAAATVAVAPRGGRRDRRAAAGRRGGGGRGCRRQRCRGLYAGRYRR